ncbi:MAG: hypothetical protein M3O46_05150 [Myxococcota bacterium]|nr:hypothetical protein [Myxococcota bacterium]
MDRRATAKEAVTPAMLRKVHASDGHRALTGVASAPRSKSTGALFLCCVAVVGAACSNGSADQVTKPVALGMTRTTPAYYADGQVTLYQVLTPVPLPVRLMTAADVRSVGAPPPGTPYPRGVFLRAEDESVEVRYTISNIDDVQHNVWLLIDPWNEFVRWRPGVTAVNDELTVPNYGYDMEFPVPAKQRLQGTITIDDMHEIAIKLASVENLLASPQAQAPGQSTTGSAFNATPIANNIFNPANRSNSTPADPLYTPWIPRVIAGVTGFDLGLRTSEPANVAVEITIDVQDLRGDRFVPQDSTSDRQMGLPPVVLSPPSARF